MYVYVCDRVKSIVSLCVNVDFDCIFRAFESGRVRNKEFSFSRRPFSQSVPSAVQCVPRPVQRICVSFFDMNNLSFIV